MLERLPRTQRNIVLVVLGALFLWFCWSIRQVVNPLLIGYLLAFILHPLVERVQQLGFSRRVAVNGIFVAGLLVIGGTIFGLVVQTRSLIADVADDPTVRDRLQAQVELVRGKIAEWFGEDWAPPEMDVAWFGEQARGILQEHSAAVQEMGRKSLAAAGDTLGMLGAIIGTVVAVLGALFLIPLYTYFLLFELERIHTFCKRHLPVRDRERLAHVAEEIGGVVSNFFRGRLGVCLLKGVFITVGLLITGIPYAFLFGMVSGFLSLIPFFGPFLGFLAAALIGTLEFGIGASIVRTGIVFGLAEMLEGYVLIPKILGDSLGLHAVVVLFALFAGGAALGMLGVLVALPLTAAILIVFREFVMPALQKSVDEDGDEAPA